MARRARESAGRPGRTALAGAVMAAAVLPLRPLCAAASSDPAELEARGDALHEEADRAYHAAMEGLRWLAKYAGDLGDAAGVKRSSRLYWSLLIARLDASSFPVAGVKLAYRPEAPEEGGPAAPDLRELARFFTEASRAFFRRERHEPRDVAQLYEALALVHRALGDRFQADADAAYRTALATLGRDGDRDDPAVGARTVALRFKLRDFEGALRAYEQRFLPARKKKGSFPAQDEIRLLRLVRDAARFRGRGDVIARLDGELRARGAKAEEVARPMADYAEAFITGSPPKLERVAGIFGAVRATYRLDPRDATLVDYLTGLARLAAGSAAGAVAPLAAATASPDPWTAAVASFRLGLAQEAIGEYQLAERAFASAAERAASLPGTSRFRVRAALDRASVLLAIGRRLEAEDALLELVRGGSLEPIDLARARVLLGAVSYAGAGEDPARLEEARATYLRAEKDLARTRDPAAAALRWQIAINRAGLARREALASPSPSGRRRGLERAIALQRAVPSAAYAAGAHRLAALAAGNVAELELELGELEKAEAQARWALEAARAVRSFETEWRVQDVLGRIAAARGNGAKARAAFAEGARIVELWRVKLSAEEDRASFLEDRSAIFRHAVRALLASGDVGEAFAYSERGRARSLLEALGGREIAFALAKDREAFGAMQRAALRAEVARRGQNEVFGVPDTRAFEELVAELEKLRREIAGRRDVSPEVRYLATGGPSGLREVQADLDPDEVLVSYYPTGDGPTGGGIAAFLVSKGAAKAVGIEAGAAGIRAQVRSFVGGGCRDRALAEALYRALVAPIAPEIEATRVTIVPYGVLFRLPFEALWDGKAYLIERWEIAYLPSASVLRFLARRPRIDGRRLLALLNPDTDYDGDGRPDKDAIPAAAGELRPVEDRFAERMVLEGRDASEDACLALAPRSEFVHFSCHGEFFAHDPWASTLFLARGKRGDGRLRAHEIFGMDLRGTDLVTVSACETGLARVTAGQDLAGLACGFLLSGARSMLVSLWKVEDRATAALMRGFYENLLASRPGASKAAALRAAKLELLRGETGADPWRWAPFILIGDR